MNSNNIPAFPAMHFDLTENERGMTLRDYFAAKAMQGMFASSLIPQNVTNDEIAIESYKIADAMLKARVQ